MLDDGSGLQLTNWCASRVPSHGPKVAEISRDDKISLLCGVCNDDGIDGVIEAALGAQDPAARARPGSGSMDEKDDFGV